MAKFKDAQGREWLIEVDLTTADEVLERCGVDLIDAEKYEDVLLKLNMNARFLLVMLWAFVKPQADTIGVTEGEFKKGLKLPDLRAAKAILLDAIADFTPHPEVAAGIKKAFRVAEQQLAEGARTATEEKLMAAMSANAVGNSPE